MQNQNVKTTEGLRSCVSVYNGKRSRIGISGVQMQTTCRKFIQSLKNVGSVAGYATPQTLQYHIIT